MLTEKEKIQRARMYMNMLSKGIDPISRKSFENDTALNNERLRKCFAYVYDVLGNTLDELYSDKKRTEKHTSAKAEFYITPEEKEKVKISDEECVISEFADAVNEAVNDTARKKLQAKKINDWLVNEGYLKNSTYGKDRTCREPTERAGEIGINSKQGIGAFGNYTIILYTRQAQEFILENIDKIIEYKEEED